MNIDSPISSKILPLLKAPDEGNETSLEFSDGTLRCIQTGSRYEFVEGVPSLFVSNWSGAEKIAERVHLFYEDNPFPNYESIGNFGDLVNKGYSNPFSRDLLQAIGGNKCILECGCGTGQLSHFLQLNNNHVLGVDISINSLKLATEFKRRNNLVRSSFAQMNLFKLAVKDESMDVVIAHGVLHHTPDARRAFQEIVKKAKPGGIVVIGLYNAVARIPTWVRAKLIPLLGPKIDYVVRTQIRDEKKRDIWINDQYFNPHETWHTIDEVISWFREENVEFLNCQPPILDTDGEEAAEMFDKTSPGTRYQRLVTQTSWLASIAREGAVFDVIGRKRD
jgi:SAM-dependent methyltransferase